MIVDGERVIGSLAARREQITRFIREAGDVAEAAAERRGDLSADVERLDDLLVELRPALVELGAAEPLRGAAAGQPPQLRRRARPPRRPVPGLRGRGRDRARGARAGERRRRGGRPRRRRRGRRARARGANGAADDRAAQGPRPRPRRPRPRGRDRSARPRAAATTRPGRATRAGRPAPTGYTGFEGLLNYAYYLAGATNQVDQIGHLLHVNIYSVGDNGSPCGGTFWTGGEPGTPTFGVPAADGGLTTKLRDAATCVSWLGPNQPGINQDLGLGPYDPSVCPEGSDAPELCRPAGSTALEPGPVPSPRRARRTRGGRRRRRLGSCDRGRPGRRPADPAAAGGRPRADPARSARPDPRPPGPAGARGRRGPRPRRAEAEPRRAGRGEPASAR